MDILLTALTLHQVILTYSQNLKNFWVENRSQMVRNSGKQWQPNLSIDGRNESNNGFEKQVPRYNKFLKSYDDYIEK